MDDRAYELAEAASGLSAGERAAVKTLLNPHEGIQLERFGGRRREYADGQHRSRAILDAGVRRTVTIVWDYPD